MTAAMGMGGSEGLDAGGVEVEGSRVDIGEQGRGTGAEDAADGGEEAEGRGDDGGAGADVEGGEGEPEGVGAAGAADGVGYAAGGGGGLLEAVDLGTEDEALTGTDGFDGREDLFADLGVLAAEVEHRDCLRHNCFYRGCHRDQSNCLQVETLREAKSRYVGQTQCCDIACVRPAIAVG